MHSIRGKCERCPLRLSHTRSPPTLLRLLLLLVALASCTAAPDRARLRRQLIFSGNNDAATVTTAAAIATDGQRTAVTIPPFREPNIDQQLSQDFLLCVQRCQTTSQYNPICASDMQLYLNEAKFECARRCGADIEIVRRGNCDGLFPMLKG